MSDEGAYIKACKEAGEKAQRATIKRLEHDIYSYKVVWTNPFLLVAAYNDAISILRNNHWNQDPTRSVWQNPNQTQFVNESHLHGDPKGAISSIGLDWDSEMRALNSAWGGIPSRYKDAIQPGAMIPVDENPWDYYTPATPKECYHEWAKYTGLNEVFTYCKKCDKKQ